MTSRTVLAPILASAALLMPAPALADVQAGVDAWARGDYPAAVREGETSAAQDEAAALYNLGQAYQFGNGTGRVKRPLASGFATEEEAKSACSQLAAAGFGCFIVRN